MRQILEDFISEINTRSSLIFVQTNAIAEQIRDFITQHHNWDPDASAYVYDSAQTDRYLRYALEKFAFAVKSYGTW